MRKDSNEFLEACGLIVEAAHNNMSVDKYGSAQGFDEAREAIGAAITEIRGRHGDEAAFLVLEDIVQNQLVDQAMLSAKRRARAA